MRSSFRSLAKTVFFARDAHATQRSTHRGATDRPTEDVHHVVPDRVERRVCLLGHELPQDL
jgi:hypothetical protein